jgi:hypothetical protein
LRTWTTSFNPLGKSSPMRIANWLMIVRYSLLAALALGELGHDRAWSLWAL